MILYATLKVLPAKPARDSDPWAPKTGNVWVRFTNAEGLALTDEKGQSQDIQIPRAWLRTGADLKAAIEKKFGGGR